MTPKATSPALQKKAETANRAKLPENNDAGRPAASGSAGPTACGPPLASGDGDGGWRVPGSGTRWRNQNNRNMVAAAGTDSAAMAADRFPVAANTAATRT